MDSREKAHLASCSQNGLLSHDGSSARKTLGAVYTPDAVADFITESTLGPELDNLISNITTGSEESLQTYLSLRVLDPACGPGTFLISTINAYKKRYDRFFAAARSSGFKVDSKVESHLQSILGNLYGVDIDPSILQTANQEIRRITGLRHNQQSPFHLHRGDSLISRRGLEGNNDHSHFFSDISERNTFEWATAIPDVFKDPHGGFDVILMNPPYIRLRPNLAEFLRYRLTMGDRSIVLSGFSVYKERLQEDVNYFKNSGEYTFSHGYTLDTYRLFIERAIRLAKEGGLIGCIVPSTLLGDISTSRLRAELFGNNQISSIREYTESARLFKNVTQSVCILTFKKGGSTNSFDLTAGITDFTKTDRYRSLRVKMSHLQKIDSQNLSIPRVSPIGYRILKKLHSFSTLKEKTWLDCRRGELDLTLDKALILDTRTSNPIIRGSHITRYHLLRPSTEEIEYVNIRMFEKKKARSRRVKHISRKRIACQQVSNRAQRWRLKFAKIPDGVVLANSCNYIVTTEPKTDIHLIFLQAIFNSDLLNWRFDLTNTNNHVSNYELSNLPFPDPFEMPDSTTAIINEEVEVLQESGISYSPRIEALVFAMFGLTEREAKHVMTSRSVPDSEARVCKAHFSSFSK
jgi:Alw26I/Eco31I/Esp3I family type II restriction m6 adenine DNA methyltransferase